MSRVTLILVPDERSRVRRFEIPGAAPRAAAVALAAFGLALALGAADWVRLRAAALDVESLRGEASREVAALRAKTARDGAALAALAREVGALEERLARLGEFERKVRVIAELPAALPETDAPAALGDAAAAEGGQGGGVEEPAAGADQAPAPVSAAGAALPGLATRAGEIGLEEAVLARVLGKAERLAARAASRASELEELTRALEGQRERLAATPSIWPTDGWITSGFGFRTSPFTGRRQFHPGLDIASDPGTPIVSVARGRVAFAGRKGPLGNTVIVDHGFGFRTTYGHAAVLHVRPGQRVERGERLGLVGSSGRSTGPHLHYAVSLRGRSVDPIDFIVD